MKKKLFVLFAAIVMVFSFTACGGSSSDGDAAGEDIKLWCGYYQADIPQGYTPNEYETEFVNPEDDSQKIKVTISSGSAEEEITSSIEFWDGDHERVDDIVVGDKTWLVETFEWNGIDSCMLYLDAGDGEHLVEVTFFELPVDGEEVQAFVNSFEIEEDPYTKSQEFMSAVNEKQ